MNEAKLLRVQEEVDELERRVARFESSEGGYSNVICLTAPPRYNPYMFGLTSCGLLEVINGDETAGSCMIDDGEVALGGRIPVNVSGGLLSKGHPLGATGIANIYEVSTHLRNEAGSRQVEGAKIGLTHVIGLGSACAIHVLERAS